jgi:hypothetical protein
MRDRSRGSLLGLVSVVLSVALAGCAGGKTEAPLANTEGPELLAMLQLGRPALNCREACLDAWKRVQPKVMQLDADARWADLAVLVMRSGYQDDLSLYYLGRAAEGMGFYTAAASYYRQSMQLSGTSISCANLSGLCGNANLPTSASLHLAASERMLIKLKARPKKPTAKAPIPSAEQPSTAEPTATTEPTHTAEPAPTAEPISLAVPTPQPASNSATLPAERTAIVNSGSGGVPEYVEPPPASK